MEQYSRGEVAYLLSLTHWDAVQDDVAQPDSCATLSPDGPMASTTHSEWDPLFTIARWNDVHAARGRVVRRRMEEGGATLEQIRFEQKILWLRGHGMTEREVGQLLAVDKLLARRRYAAALDMVLDELGGEAAASPDRRSTVPACMKCADWPRARIAERTRRRAGRAPIVIRPERLSSLCWDCTPAARRRLLVVPRSMLQAEAS